jgi:hypothetical protein
MPWVGLEPMIPAFERARIVHALDRAVTVTGKHENIMHYNYWPHNLREDHRCENKVRKKKKAKRWSENQKTILQT